VFEQFGCGVPESEITEQEYMAMAISGLAGCVSVSSQFGSGPKRTA